MTHDSTLTVERLQELERGEDWNAILAATAELDRNTDSSAHLWLFRATALLKTQAVAKALDAANKGLALDPSSDWANQLVFNILLAAGQREYALERLRSFIELSEDKEQTKAVYVLRAAELNMFEAATEVNENREVINTAKPNRPFALALQCFAKLDTLKAVLDSLCRLKSPQNFNLIIISDTCNPSRHEKYLEGHKDVLRLLGEQIPDLSRIFGSVEFVLNPMNLGTAPTCRRLLDLAARSHEGFLFVEDDCVLSPSALEWAEYHLRNSIDLSKDWFFTCESVFFDKQGRYVEKDLLARLTAISNRSDLAHAYHMLDFVPSTCFGTSSDVWRKCASVRSFTRGPESLTRYTKAHGKKTISPVVPRASDIGMLHELGYSVNMVGRDKVKENKDTYVLGPGFDSSRYARVDVDIDTLYGATSQLNPDDLIALEQL